MTLVTHPFEGNCPLSEQTVPLSANQGQKAVAHAPRKTGISGAHRFLGEALLPYGFDMAYLAADTKVLTHRGDIAVGDLKDEDKVFTLDSGMQSVAHKVTIQIDDPAATGPISIAKGALKNRRAMLVAPNQHLLIRDWHAELLFGDNEVLVPARQLINGSTIKEASAPTVTYVGLIFMEHQIVLAEGIPCETLDIAAVGGAKGPLTSALPSFKIHSMHKNETARRLLHPHEAELLINTMKVGQTLPSWAA